MTGVGLKQQDKEQAVPRLAAPRRRRWFRVLVRVMAAPFVVLVCMAACLEWKGFPQPWVTRIRAYLAENEFFADMRAIRFQFPASLAIEGLRLYENPTDRIPMLEADRVRVGWSPLTAWRRRQNIATLRVRGASVVLRGRPTAQNAEPALLTLEQLNLYAWFARDGFRLGFVEGMFEGIKITGDAFIEPLPRDPTAPPLALRDMARTLRATLAQASEWVPSVVAVRRQIELPVPPRLDFHAHWVPAQWAQSSAELKATGFRAAYRGAVFDRWNAHFRLTNGVLEMPGLSAVQGACRFIARGQIVLTNNALASFHAYSTLPPGTWLCFLPLTNLVGACPVECSGDSRSHFQIWLGPAPWAAIGRNITGWAEVNKAVVKDVPIERFFAHVVLDGNVLRLDYTELNLPDLGFRGKAELNLASLDYEIRGMVAGDPHVALPWIPENPAAIIRDLGHARDLTVTGRVAGCITNFQAFSIESVGHGEQFTFRGVEVGQFDAIMRYSNDVFELRDMVVRRPEGEAKGWVRLDFDRKIICYDAESAIAPHAAAKVLGSNIYEFLSHFRFDGTAFVRSRGTVDYGTFEQTDLQADVHATRAGWDRFLADKVDMHIEAKGQRVTFTNVHGMVYGGNFMGQLAIENIGSTSSLPRYHLEAWVKNADFNRFVRETGELTKQPYQGTLSATVSVSGAIGAGMGKTAEGGGKLQIRNGRLFQLPLLGGLSHFLAKIYPGFGFASQTDLSTEFVIADGAVCTDDIELQGNMLSIFGYGCYRFDGKLDFRVQVKLLRRSYPAYVVRFLTFPVTKLLEFHLSGSVDDPKWRPQNLPKELFLMFD